MRAFEDVAAALTRIVNRPAGERTRHLGHVLLRVAAVHAERVQLHQLAAVVLVQSLSAAGCRGGARLAGRDGRRAGSALIQLSR